MQAPVILILKNNKEKPGWVSCAGICLCWVRDWVFARPGWMVAPRQGLSCQPRVGFNPEAFLWGKKFSWEKDFLRKKKRFLWNRVMETGLGDAAAPEVWGE